MKILIGIIIGSVLLIGLIIWAVMKEIKRQINNN